MAKILMPGFESAVRSKLGVGEYELPDSEINQRFVLDLAENEIIKRVPDYNKITDEADLLYLENAVIALICSILAPSMDRRLNQKVSTIDTKWEKSRIDWSEKAKEFLAEMEDSLSNIESVDVSIGESIELFQIAKASEEG